MNNTSKYSLLSDADKAMFKEYYLSGCMPIGKIAKLFNMSTSTVNKTARTLGLKRKKINRNDKENDFNHKPFHLITPEDLEYMKRVVQPDPYGYMSTIDTSASDLPLYYLPLPPTPTNSQTGGFMKLFKSFKNFFNSKENNIKITYDDLMEKWKQVMSILCNYHKEDIDEDINKYFINISIVSSALVSALYLYNKGIYLHKTIDESSKYHFDKTICFFNEVLGFCFVYIKDTKKIKLDYASNYTKELRNKHRDLLFKYYKIIDQWIYLCSIDEKKRKSTFGVEIIAEITKDIYGVEKLDLILSARLLEILPTI